MLFQPRLRMHLELHRRLFFGRAEERRSPLLADTFRPRLGASSTDVPSPDVGAGLALYLLLHGASSRWFRLKWLVDLHPLLAGMTPSQVEILVTAAHDMKATATVTAGLRLFEQVFETSLPEPWHSWLAETAGDRGVEGRLAAYIAALNRPDAASATRQGDQFDSLDMYFRFIDSFGYRTAVILRGGAWIAIRALGRLLPSGPQG